MLKTIFQLILSMFTNTKETFTPENKENKKNMKGKGQDDENSPPETIYPMW